MEYYEKLNPISKSNDWIFIANESVQYTHITVVNYL